MANVRDELARLMKATIADHANWTYAAVRPMPVPRAPWRPGQHVRGDCSKGVQFLCRWAGAPDPMKNNWGPDGNSATLWLRLQHLDNPSQLMVGDIVTFGHNGDEHAGMVLEAGADPLLWNFGHQGTPNSYRLSYDRRPHQLLRLPYVYLPTPQDRLRARTGWFAWVAWRLGEGDWEHYPKGAKRVRPNVPRVIPAGWWLRYGKFLRNRGKAG